MTDFEKVSDDLRALRPRSPGRHRLPVNVALIAGDTVFVPANGRPMYDVQHTIRRSLARLGYSLHANQHEKDGVLGFVMWAEPKDGPA